MEVKPNLAWSRNVREFVDANSSKRSPTERRGYSEVVED